ncbi:MAG: acyl-CoA dehydrogenase [Chloroflexi bacterium]|nr:MAG: acyl-CoA dehydrogenase [Chloroflexota bacterium]
MGIKEHRPMDFHWSEEQEMFLSLFRDFAQKEVAPRAEETDHQEKPPMEVLRRAAMQGFLGATLPEEQMGAGLDHVSYGLLIEELAKACLSTALIVAIHNSLVAETILAFGSPEQQETYLPMLAAGEAIGAFALNEADAGADFSRLATRAIRQDDGYLLRGSKWWVANGEIAGLFIVFAASDPTANGRGLSAFLVEADTPGLRVAHREPTLGLRGLPLNVLYLDDCQVPAANRLGAEGDGYAIAVAALDRFRIALGSAALGVSEAALAAGVRFASERKQFDALIAQKQAIQNFIAEAKARIEGLRYLVYHAGWLLDQGADVEETAALVKLWAGEVSRFVTDKMVQVHGGYGYMEEYPISRMYRDARALGLIGGPTELQRVTIARSLFAPLGVEILP